MSEVSESRLIQTVTNDPKSIQDANAEIATVESANRAMISNIRQGVQLGIFAAQAMGLMIDQTLTLLIEALLLSIEVGLAISAGTFGIIQVVQIGTIVAMGILIVQIRRKQTEAARQTQAIVGGLRMVGFRGS